MNHKPVCPHCGRPVIPSEVDGYTYQCLECDEDFAEFECTYKDMTTIIIDNLKNLSKED